MRTNILIVGLAMALSACGGSAPKGTGFTGIGGEASVNSAAQRPLQGNYSYKPSPTEEVTVRRLPGGQTVKTYRYGSPAPNEPVLASVVPTPERVGGVPVFTTKTHSKNSNYGVAPVLISGRTALGYASSRWGSAYTVPIQAGDGSARLKIVVTDGLTFGVVAKLKRPFFGGRMSNSEYEKSVVKAVVRRTGCSYGGRTVVKSDQYSTPQRFAVHLNC